MKNNVFYFGTPIEGDFQEIKKEIFDLIKLKYPDCVFVNMGKNLVMKTETEFLKDLVKQQENKKLIEFRDKPENLEKIQQYVVKLKNVVEDNWFSKKQMVDAKVCTYKDFERIIDVLEVFNYIKREKREEGERFKLICNYDEMVEYYRELANKYYHQAEDISVLAQQLMKEKDQIQKEVIDEVKKKVDEKNNEIVSIQDTIIPEEVSIASQNEMIDETIPPVESEITTIEREQEIQDEEYKSTFKE